MHMYYMYIYIYKHLYIYIKIHSNIYMYTGKKEGFLFQSGIKGLGYYIDKKSKISKKNDNEIETKIHEKNEIKNPTISSIQKQEINKSVIDISFLPFPYDYRQTKQAIAILVQVYICMYICTCLS
jgi:bacillopeptidase F (M6 metalloprotease family)